MIIKYIETTAQLDYQLVSPHSHRANPAERAIVENIIGRATIGNVFNDAFRLLRSFLAFSLYFYNIRKIHQN